MVHINKLPPNYPYNLRIHWEAKKHPSSTNKFRYKKAPHNIAKRIPKYEHLS